MSRLRSQVPPLGTASYINRLIALRCIFNELAWTVQLPELAHLIRRNRLGGNVFLLIRHTGMRIGECADLSFDSFREPQLRVWHVDDIPVSYMMLSEMCAQTWSLRETSTDHWPWFLVDDGLRASHPSDARPHHYFLFGDRPGLNSLVAVRALKEELPDSRAVTNLESAPRRSCTSVQ
jgi:hypothetical protein